MVSKVCIPTQSMGTRGAQRWQNSFFWFPRSCVGTHTDMNSHARAWELDLYELQVSDKDFYIDLLFYHIQLRCYVVIELKTTEFKPEFVGKLNFYISAVDAILASEQDNATIGLLICKSKNKTIVEYALKDMQQAMGISEYQLTQHLPESLQSSLPSIAEIGGFGDE